MKYFVLFSIVLLVSCGGTPPTKKVENTINNVGKIDSTKICQNSINFIGNSIGVICVNDKYLKSDTIEIFNFDGSLWHKFTFYYDDSDGLFEYNKKEFLPFSFNPDNFLLTLKVMKVSEDKYFVIVNDSINRQFFVKKSPFYSFMNWEEFVLKSSAVGIDRTQSKIYNDCKESASKCIVNGDELFKPIEIKGDWLRLSWKEGKTVSYGWIKWKEKNALMIEIFNEM